VHFAALTMNQFKTQKSENKSKNPEQFFSRFFVKHFGTSNFSPRVSERIAF
jgi:hypothetical protein